jgi:hypothetical protein
MPDQDEVSEKVAGATASALNATVKVEENP